MADCKKYGRTANLFDYQTMDGTIKGYYLNSNGNIQESAFAAITDYIPCSGGNFCLAKVGGVSTSICLYDNNKHFLYGQAYNTSSGSDKQTIVVNSSVNASYIRFTYFYTAAPQDDLSAIMLNSGSTALPYQPYLDWQHSLRKLTTATEAVENPLYSDGTAITSYTIKGNTVQNGTPTPSSPIQPSECGERTGNLYNINAKDVNNGYVNNTQLNQDGTMESYIICEVTEYIELIPNASYRLSNIGSFNSLSYCIYDSDKQYITGYRYSGQTVKAINMPPNGKYLRFSHSKSRTDTMLNIGSTALPYEPYGYKIPILSANTTTNIYLGEVETTRKIRKLVLTGNEVSTVDASSNQAIIPLPERCLGVIPLCSHYIGRITSAWSTLINGEIAVLRQGSATARICDTTHATTATNYNNYLAQQYAAGTPVTVWYVLETETTGVVNEPLMKIGDYADTLSNAASIPTTEGANSITVDTTVQPSEFTATWTGWHDSSVKEWDGSDWQ